MNVNVNEIIAERENAKRTDLAMLNAAHEISFLAHHETGETRGGDGDLPYYIHTVIVAGWTLEVMNKLSDEFFSPYTKGEVAAATVLHDVPEDCHEKWLEVIRHRCGKNVLSLALMLRNGHYEVAGGIDLPREARKKLDFAKLADPERVHRAVIPAKYMDRTHNLRTCGHWKFKRQGKYVEESEVLLPVLDARLRGLGGIGGLNEVDAVADITEDTIAQSMIEGQMPGHFRIVTHAFVAPK